MVHYTTGQEIQLEAVRAALTKAEAQWRDANEKELPEEKFRVVVEAKRAELANLMKQFALENEERRSFGSRRRRDHGRRPVGQEEDGDAFVNFSSNRRRGRPEEQHA